MKTREEIIDIIKKEGTWDETLYQRFKGAYEDIVTYLLAVAERQELPDGTLKDEFYDEMRYITSLLDEETLEEIEG